MSEGSAQRRVEDAHQLHISHEIAATQVVSGLYPFPEFSILQLFAV